MGRTEPSYAPMAQQSFRKDQRAKHARLTINKTIPQILDSDSRARKGVDSAYLFTGLSDESKSSVRSSSQKSNPKSQHSRKSSKYGKAKDIVNEDEPAKTAVAKPQEDAKPVRISIQATDTLMAARDLHEKSRSRKNVAILNMASPLRPGGGVLNGATSQEESLCTRTTLLPSLKDEWYRLPESGAIWSPDVLVFRMSSEPEQGDTPKSDRFYVDVVTAAMTRFPDTVEKAIEVAHDDSEKCSATVERVYASQKDRELALNKMRKVLELLKFHQIERVVLGAWGCGAYGNPTGEISRAWKRVLLGTRSKNVTARNQAVDLGNLKEVVFAIKDPRMAEEFAVQWGDGIEVERRIKAPRGLLSADPTEQQVVELKQKIAALQIQLVEVKTPMLRQGLESTLITLQTQLDRIQLEDRDGTESLESDDE